MAKRTLETLQKRYSSRHNSGSMRGMGGPRGGGPGARARAMGGGKPKNTAHTIKRLFSYVGKYPIRLLLVGVCMLTSAVTSLIGSFSLFFPGIFNGFYNL